MFTATNMNDFCSYRSVTEGCRKRSFDKSLACVTGVHKFISTQNDLFLIRKKSCRNIHLNAEK